MFPWGNKAQINQEEKICELKAAIGPITGANLKFCTDACLGRFLKARNWDVLKAKAMLEETLKWRSSFKPEEIRWHDVERESETGILYKADFQDRDGGIFIVVKLGKMQELTTPERLTRYLVYVMENVILNMPEGQQGMAWLVDYTNWSFNDAKKYAGEPMDIMQKHYPETLAAAFFYNPPGVFEIFWKVFKIFMDPVSAQKIKLVYPQNGKSKELLQQHFDLDVLPEEFGGNNKIEYNHKEYAKLMSKDDIKMATAWGLEAKSSNAVTDNSTPGACQLSPTSTSTQE